MRGICLPNHAGREYVPQARQCLIFSWLSCAMRLHYVYSGFWGGVERKCLKFKSEKSKLSLYMLFAHKAQAYFSSGAVVVGEANLRLGSCER